MQLVDYDIVGIGKQQLKDAVKATLEFIKLVSSEEIEMIKVFNSKPK